jgi:hypothetical protein
MFFGAGKWIYQLRYFTRYAANTNSLYSDNAFTSTLTVAPNLNSSLTGSGPTGFNDSADTSFGNLDFRAYNIDFRNDAYPYSNGPSLAVSVSRANTGFYSCGFFSYQDTVSTSFEVSRLCN